MSKSVQEAIVAVANITKKRGEEEQDYLKRVVEAIAEASDADWNSLPVPAQDWFNLGVDAIKENKDIPAFPKEAAPAASTRRTASKKTEAAPETESVVGAEVIVTNARGKVVQGIIKEIDEESMLVEDAEGQEHDFDRSRVKSVEFVTKGDAGTQGDAAPQVGDEVVCITKRGKEVTGTVTAIEDNILVLNDDIEVDMDTAKSITVAGASEDAADTDPAVGDEVVCITKRGKEVTGKVTAIEDNILVLDDDVEVDMDTAQAIKIVAAKKSSRGTATVPAAARGRSTAPTKDKGEGKTTKITAKSNDGVSATTRMFEIICEEPTITVEGVAKQLKAEKLVFKDATLAINFKTANKVIELLKQNKHFR